VINTVIRYKRTTPLIRIISKLKIKEFLLKKAFKAFPYVKHPLAVYYKKLDLSYSEPSIYLLIEKNTSKGDNTYKVIGRLEYNTILEVRPVYTHSKFTLELRPPIKTVFL